MDAIIAENHLFEKGAFSYIVTMIFAGFACAAGSFFCFALSFADSSSLVAHEEYDFITELVAEAIEILNANRFVLNQ